MKKFGPDNLLTLIKNAKTLARYKMITYYFLVLVFERQLLLCILFQKKMFYKCSFKSNHNKNHMSTKQNHTMQFLPS